MKKAKQKQKPIKTNSIIQIKVTGKNINNFIRKIIKNQINIQNLTITSYREAKITLRYKEYQKLISIKTIYKIEIIKVYGWLLFKQKLQKNSLFLFMLALGIGFIYFLSFLIFDIQVIHSNREIRELLYTELEKHGISKYSFKKSYDELEKIESQILEANKDSLEWIEIIETGTKYTIRVEERIINQSQIEQTTQHIIATKNAILTEINASSGEKVKKINDYIKKGDIIISGNIIMPNGTIKSTTAQGQVYGEVWYTVTINYPYIYHEERKTGEEKDVFVINFLNKRWELLNFNPFKHYVSQNKVLLSHNFLPITFQKEKQQEILVIENIYTEDEALTKSIAIAKQKLISSNKNIREVKDFQILEQSSTSNIIYLKLFISVIEEIGTTQIIEPPTDQIIPE